MVLVFGSGRHYATALLGTEFRNRAVQHVDLIEEIHGCNGAIKKQILSVKAMIQ